MPETPLNQLSAHGQSVWIDFLSRTFVRDGDLEALVREGVNGVTSNPTIFQSAIARRRRLRRAAARGAQVRDRAQGGLPRARRRGHPRRLRHPAPAVGRGRRERPRRLGLARGRPAPRPRHRGHDRGGQAPARARRPPEPVHQDPRHEGGPARDRGDDRRRHPGQRDADLLARAPPRGRRGLHPRRAALRRRRRRPADDGVRGLVLRLARRHRGRQAPRRRRRPRRAQGHARDRQRQARLPRPTRRSSRATRGRRCGPRARRRSAACGRPRRPRTPTTAT